MRRVVADQSLKVGVLNVRSLGNKSAAVHDVIVDNLLDLFAIVESWHDSAESPSVVAATPPGYYVIERARPRTTAASLAVNHGGLCLFIRRVVHASVVNLPAYKSFESLAVTVHHGTLSFVLVVIYRPSAASALTANDEFFVDFSDMLERTSTFAGCVIAGDVNIHLDDTSSTHVSTFNALLDDFGLHDLVCQPTHSCGHQLNVFITRIDQSTRSVTVDPPLLSDHSLIQVAFGVSTTQTSTTNTLVWRRRWSAFDYDGFISELEQSRLVLDAPSDVSELVECYDSTLSSLLDKFAPQRQVRIKARPSAPWFDADCRRCKAATRKLEKAYRKKPCDQSRSAWQMQFSSQRELFQQKLVAYWTTTIDACGNNSKALWTKLRPLLQPRSDGDTFICRRLRTLLCDEDRPHPCANRFISTASYQ